jgi:hypothetical protein
MTEREHVDAHIRHTADKHRELNAYLHRGAMPPIADRPAPSQAFNEGAHTGREAAVSRQVRDFDRPRKE